MNTVWFAGGDTYIDFDKRCIDELLRIQDAVDVLMSYDIGQDPEMINALGNAIDKKRNEQRPMLIEVA